MPESVVGYGDELPSIPGRVPWEEPRSHLVKDARGGYQVEPGRRPSKALLVNRLRAAVGTWRENGYPGASAVTIELFRYWFEEDHLLPDGTLWRYHFGQREALETLAYLVEVARIADSKDLVDQFGEAFEGSRLIKHGIVHQTGVDGRRRIVRFFPELGSEGIQELPPEGLLRYAFKAATGSGKTVVMALIVAWSYFHRTRVPGSPLSRNFLILAPNVIVYQRLERDFASNAIFENLPIIPLGWRGSFDLKPILRGENAEPSPNGTLFLTNIQQVYERRDAEWTPENAVAALLGRPVTKDLASHERSMLERVRSLPDLLALNDEAHHVHDEDLEWNKTLSGIRDRLRLWLDFSATPKDQNATYYPWIISDYPLPQAVEDGIVKAPIIVQRVERADPEKVTAENVVEAYGEWLAAAVARWREHQAAYKRSAQQPVLFIMAEKSEYADRISRWLVETKELGLKPKEVLVIHTNLAGDILKGDLDAARRAAATIDDPTNPVKVIVSVMMLREGWDVRSVTVVLGLRPFTAKAQILPEQAVGRGLRLLPGVEGTQTLEVMGTRAFETFVQQLETEGLAVPVTQKPPALPIVVEPIRERSEFDIAIPLTRPLFEHSVQKLAELDPASIGPLTGLNNVVVGDELRFVLEFMTTGSRIGEVRLAYPVELPQVAVGRLVESILDKARIPSRFAELYPIIEEYLREVAFGRVVDLNERTVATALSNFVLRERLAGEIARRIGELTVEERPIEFEQQEFRLSTVAPFAWRRQHVQLLHTIFNFVTVYNDYEKRFAEFLDTRPDIERWAALAEQFTRFNVTYLNVNGALKRYYPDFVAVQTTDVGDVHWILETKGRVFADVVHKDKGIRAWCHALHEQSGQEWRYRRIDQLAFDKGQFATFDALIAAVDSTTVRAPGIFDAEAIVPAPAATPSRSLLARVTDALDAAGWLAEPVAGSIDPPYLRALDPSETGHVIAVFEGPRRVSRSELEGVAALRASSEDEAWQWVAVSKSGFSADARMMAADADLELRTADEFIEPLAHGGQEA
jgi:type III restriction enzyme